MWLGIVPPVSTGDGKDPDRVGHALQVVLAAVREGDTRRSPQARSRTVCDTRISLGADSADTRAATLTAPPKTLPSSRITSPACKPRWSGSPAPSPALAHRRAAAAGVVGGKESGEHAAPRLPSTVRPFALSITARSAPSTRGHAHETCCRPTLPRSGRWSSRCSLRTGLRQCSWRIETAVGSSLPRRRTRR